MSVFVWVDPVIPLILRSYIYIRNGCGCVCGFVGQHGYRKGSASAVHCYGVPPLHCDFINDSTEH